MDGKLIVSSSPHISSPVKTKNIMLDVIIALIPSLIASIYFFGIRAAIIVIVSVATCVISEYICRKVMKREQTIGDLSAVVTGILLAFNLPSSVPIYVPIIGGIIAIVMVKQMFGGLGQNFVNPALLARIVLMNSFPVLMTTWYPARNFNADVEACASPLANIWTFTSATAAGDMEAAAKAASDIPSYLDMFIGNIPGCLGETSALCLLVGGIYLVIKKVISPIIPVTYIATVFVLSFALGLDPVAQILCGGLFLGAIFMATDYVTSPLTNKGKFIYALCCGIITVLIRVFASLPEGVSYSIVLMNIIVPLIERVTIPKPFGTVKEAK